MLDDLTFNELKEQYMESSRLLLVAKNEIDILQKRLKYGGDNIRRKYQKIIKDNRELEKSHKNNLLDISEYRAQYNEIQKKLQFQNSQIQSLTKENEQLKLKMKKKEDRYSPRKNNIRGISDLRKSFGLNLKEIGKFKGRENMKKNVFKDEEEDKEEEEEGEVTPGCNTDQKEAEFEKLKKLKMESEEAFLKLQEIISSYYKQADNEYTYVVNYRNYLESLNNQIRSFRQQLRISVVGAPVNIVDMSGGKLDQFTKDMESTTNILNQIDDSLNRIKKRTLKKAENILRSIQTKLLEINSNKKLSYGYLSTRMDTIINQREDLKKLCQVLQRSLADMYNQRKEIEKNINILKKDIERIMNNYKEGKRRINDAIRKTIRKTGKNIFSSINKSIRDEKEDEEEDNDAFEGIAEEGDQEDDDLFRGSTLIGINDFGKNIDLFKSKIIFDNRYEKDENRIREPKILRKNWNEVCYIYDDYDMHDVNYEIKAVGLGPFSFFNSCSNGFYMGKDIEIIDLEINERKAKYQYDNYCLDFNITLKNTQTAKIHLKYKERPNYNTMPSNEKSRYKFFRQEYYGLSENLSGQMGKYRLILKGSFDIVCFKDDFFIKNEQNKKEKEYIWGGKIPSGGKRTLVKLSKNEAVWSVDCNTQIISRRGFLNNTVLKVPMGFVGGNNTIIKLDYSSPQTKNIEVDEENRLYEIRYKNTRFSQGNFIISGEIRNRCRGEWDVDLTDETIERNIPSEDKRDKKMLEKIARKIIQDFDRNNKDNIHNFMDFTKIGKWVNQNIKYDINYSGRTEMTAMDIYNKRVGVCHHMTRLSNALLYSLGYKVIYTNGFASESAEFDQNCAHAWSLINVNGKWYPFDATWGILSGKLPVCHVFQGFFGKSITLVGTDGAVFGRDNNREAGKYIR